MNILVKQDNKLSSWRSLIKRWRETGMSKRSYPKMILFDYEHTLLYEPGWDSVRGNAKLLKYVTKNPNNCTLDGAVLSAIFFGRGGGFKGASEPASSGEPV